MLLRQREAPPYSALSVNRPNVLGGRVPTDVPSALGPLIRARTSPLRSTVAVPSERFAPRSSSVVSLLKYDPSPACRSEAVGPAKSCRSASRRTPEDLLARRGLGQTLSRGVCSGASQNKNTWILGSNSGARVRDVRVVRVDHVVAVEGRSPPSLTTVVGERGRASSRSQSDVQATSDSTRAAIAQRRPT